MAQSWSKSLRLSYELRSATSMLARRDRGNPHSRSADSSRTVAMPLRWCSPLAQGQATRYDMSAYCETAAPEIWNIAKVGAA
jgi:hypothetical protein